MSAVSRQASRFLKAQRRSREQLAAAVAAWAALSKASKVTGVPVTTVAARNADGVLVRITITATITPITIERPLP